MRIISQRRRFFTALAQRHPQEPDDMRKTCKLRSKPRPTLCAGGPTFINAEIYAGEKMRTDYRRVSVMLCELEAPEKQLTRTQMMLRRIILLGCILYHYHRYEEAASILSGYEIARRLFGIQKLAARVLQPSRNCKSSRKILLQAVSLAPEIGSLSLRVLCYGEKRVDPARECFHF